MVQAHSAARQGELGRITAAPRPAAESPRPDSCLRHAPPCMPQSWRGGGGDPVQGSPLGAQQGLRLRVDGQPPGRRRCAAGTGRQVPPGAAAGRGEVGGSGAIRLGAAYHVVGRSVPCGRAQHAVCGTAPGCSRVSAVHTSERSPVGSACRGGATADAHARALCAPQSGAAEPLTVQWADPELQLKRRRAAEDSNPDNRMVRRTACTPRRVRSCMRPCMPPRPAEAPAPSQPAPTHTTCSAPCSTPQPAAAAVFRKGCAHRERARGAPAVLALWAHLRGQPVPRLSGGWDMQAPAHAARAAGWGSPGGGWVAGCIREVALSCAFEVRGAARGASVARATHPGTCAGAITGADVTVPGRKPADVVAHRARHGWAPHAGVEHAAATARRRPCHHLAP